MSHVKRVLVLLVIFCLLTPTSIATVTCEDSTPRLQGTGNDVEALFQDDFSQGLSKWNSTSAGAWSVENQELQGSSDEILGMISAGESAWTDYVFSVNVKNLEGLVHTVLVRWQDPDNYYRITLAQDRFEFWLRRSGGEELLYREFPWGFSIDMKQWHEVKVKLYGVVPTIEAYIDGQPRITIKDLSGQSMSSGIIGLAVEAGAVSLFDDVKVTTLQPDIAGSYSVILLLVEFSDVRHIQSPQEVYEKVFPTLNRYYAEVSYNLVSVNGEVTPEWRVLQKPSSYYDISSITGSGWMKGRTAEFLADAIHAWDGEVDYREYDYVFVAGPRDSVWGYAETCCLQITTDDGITVTRGSGERENYDWRTYAHELGHIFSLPDLYSYEIAFSGPRDWREAAVYVGPWDLMSRSDERPQIGAWGKAKLGWIPPSRIVELLPGEGAVTILDPLERPTSGIQSVMIHVNATTYFVVENRRPIGFDEVLPDKGVLVSHVDEAKYWRGNGPVVVQGADPGSGPRWQMLHPTYDIAPGKKDLFTNQTYNLAVALLDRKGDSYLIAAGVPNFVESARSAYSQASELVIKAESALAAAKLQDYRSENARALIDQAVTRYLHATQALGKGTLASFELASNLAKETIGLINAANQAEQQYQPQQPQLGLSEQTIAVSSVLVVAITGAVFYVTRRRRRKARA